MSTSQFKVTIYLLSDHVVKATLTHSSTVLSSLSSSSFEDLSFLSYAVVVYAFIKEDEQFPLLFVIKQVELNENVVFKKKKKENFNIFLRKFQYIPS